MKKISHLITLLVLLFCSTLAKAQDQTGEGIGATMRSNGRIYVVITVIMVIVIGMIIYLVRLDRKISKLEKES